MASGKKEQSGVADTDWARIQGAGDLFGEIHLAEQSAESGLRTGRLFPGLAVCATAAAAAAWLSDHYGFPVILLGLIVGLALNFVSADERTHKGLDFASRSFLRLGIAALGLQVSFAQIFQLGPVTFAALLVVMLATVGAGFIGARLSGQTKYAGLLAGGATAICGASAALALYGVIGRKRLPQSQFALTLVGISVASAIAMTCYPIIASELHLTDAQAGFVIGAAVHDVAQAIGGGYAFSDAAGASATIVKLARVAMLAPIVALVGLFLNSSGAGHTTIWRRLALPWFIVAFFGLVVLNSLISFPAEVQSMALTASKALLLLAVTATAMRTHLALLLKAGWRATVPIMLATITSFAVALLFALLLI